MGNTLCSDTKIAQTTHIIQKKDYETSNDLLHLHVGSRGMNFISQHNLPQWKHHNGQKYYFGNFINDKASGIGIYFLPLSQYYEGNFDEGLPNKNGYLRLLDRKQYFQGQFEMGVAHGQGRFVSQNPNYEFQFQGEWKNSQVISGKLIPLKHNIIKQITLNKRNPNDNRILFSIGDVYMGALNSYFQPNGQGNYKFNANSKMQSYQGGWFKGQFQGKGICKWKDGTVYQGEYLANIKNGHGKFTYKSGKYYEGHWANGIQQGFGTLYSPDQKIITTGVWSQGKIVIQMKQAIQRVICNQKLPNIKQQQMKLQKAQTSLYYNQYGHEHQFI